MFAWLANYICKSRIKSANSVRQKHFVSWSKIERITLILDDKNAISKNEVDRFTDSLKKYVEVFLVETSSKQPSYGDWKCLVKKDCNWLGLPHLRTLEQLRSKRTDVVINAGSFNPLYSANLTACLTAAFKCGNKNMFGELDLIIEKKEGQSLISYLMEVQKYLQMIRTE